MPAAESTIVFLPRFTTITDGEFTTQPLDVSQFASAQFQFWRGAGLGSSDAALTLYLEESLDCVDWVQGPSAPKPVTIKPGKKKLFSYGFRLRWFRLRIDNPASLATCWAEGILR